MPPPIDMGGDEEVKGDMTPMIDLIFLLLIFFILTTKFIPDEKVVTSLLPTDKGQAQSTPQVVEPPQDINILIYPGGMVRGGQPSGYDGQWKTQREINRAIIRVGGNAAAEIDGIRLREKGARDQPNEELEAIHSYVAAHLTSLEKPAGSRKDQDPIIIHCFSGMPWKYALAVYDAIRYYESTKTPGVTGQLSHADLLTARSVSFAPPRVRNYHQWELGYELYEIIHLR